MAKNNALIELIKQNQKQIQKLTPELYASVALALHEECGFGYERINRVFARSQEIWTNFKDEPLKMIDLCEQKTNIRIDYIQHSK